MGIWIVLTQSLILRAATKLAKPKNLVLIFLLMLAGSFFCLLLPEQGWGQYLVMPFIAIAYGIVGPNITSMISNSVSPAIQGEVFGIQHSVNAVALAITPLIGMFGLNWGVEIPIFLAAGSLILAWIAFSVQFGFKKDPPTPKDHPASAPKS